MVGEAPLDSVSPIALLANLVVVPWVSLLMTTGFLLCAVGLLLPQAVVPLAISFTLLSRGLSLVVTWFSGLPGASWSW